MTIQTDINNLMDMLEAHQNITNDFHQRWTDIDDVEYIGVYLQNVDESLNVIGKNLNTAYTKLSAKSRV